MRRSLEAKLQAAPWLLYTKKEGVQRCPGAGSVSIWGQLSYSCFNIGTLLDHGEGAECGCLETIDIAVLFREVGDERLGADRLAKLERHQFRCGELCAVAVDMLAQPVE